MMSAEEMIYRIGTWILGLMLIGSITMGVGTLKELSGSVNELNLKIGIMVERTDTLQRAVQDHDMRLRSIELKR